MINLRFCVISALTMSHSAVTSDFTLPPHVYILYLYIRICTKYVH